MTAKEVGRRLGLTKSQVQVIEFRAINKVRAAFGIAPLPEPGWIARMTPRGTGRPCSACGERGHYRSTCASRRLA